MAWGRASGGTAAPSEMIDLREVESEGEGAGEVASKTGNGVARVRSLQRQKLAWRLETTASRPHGRSGRSGGLGGRVPQSSVDEQGGEGRSKRVTPDGDEGESSGREKRARGGTPSKRQGADARSAEGRVSASTLG